MFIFVLDIHSIDYNALYDQAMAMMKEHPELAGGFAGKIGGKLGGFMFKRIPDVQKGVAIADMVNQKQGELIPQLEQAVGNFCPLHISKIEAASGASDHAALRFYIHVSDVDLTRAGDLLCGTLLREPDLPEVLGSYYRPGMSVSEVRTYLLSLPMADQELALLRIIKLHRFDILRSIEMAAGMKNVKISFYDMRFYIR